MFFLFTKRDQLYSRDATCSQRRRRSRQGERITPSEPSWLDAWSGDFLGNSWGSHVGLSGGVSPHMAIFGVPHVQIKRRAHETNIASIACFSLEFSTERCTAAGGRSRKYGRRLEIGRRQKQIRPIACTNTVNTCAK